MKLTIFEFLDFGRPKSTEIEKFETIDKNANTFPKINFHNSFFGITFAPK